MRKSRIENGELRTPHIRALSHFSLLTSHCRAVRGRPAFALYLLTLSIGLLLAGTALTLVAMQRSERRLQENLLKTNELTCYARSGLETALGFIEQTSTWRARAAAAGGKLYEDFAIGDGLVTVQLYDDIDGVLTNDPTQRVRLRSTAKRGTATCVLEAQLQPRSHPALKYALFGTSASDMNFKSISVARGPIRSHGNIKAAAGTGVQDDATFETMTGYTIQDPLTPKLYAATTMAAPQPDLAVFEALATVIAGDAGAKCVISGGNLSPTVNTRGAVNANGIYWLKAGGREVSIENLHVKGTLIITETAGKKVIFGKGLFVEPGPLQYPVLLIDCPLNDVVVGPDANLNELTLWLTLGWPGADMNSDGDVADLIPPAVRGIIWTNAPKLYLQGSAWNFIGCAIGTDITIDNGAIVDNDLTLQDTFIPGFLDSGMNLVAGSIREVWP